MENQPVQPDGEVMQISGGWTHTQQTFCEHGRCEDVKQKAQCFVLMESTNRTKECIYTQQRSARHSGLPEVLSKPTPVSVSSGSELPPISSREKLCGS